MGTVKRNPAGGAEVPQPGGYEDDAGAAFGVGTLDFEGHLFPRSCSATGAHVYAIFIDHDVVQCRTCTRTISGAEYLSGRIATE